MLSFQKLDVYQRALQFLVVALEVISSLPRGNGELAAQLRSSAQSTVANIAEGAGRRTRADASHHYFIARGSAMESAAHLDVMKVMGIVELERYRRVLAHAAAQVRRRRLSIHHRSRTWTWTWRDRGRRRRRRRETWTLTWASGPAEPHHVEALGGDGGVAVRIQPRRYRRRRGRGPRPGLRSRPRHSSTITARALLGLVSIEGSTPNRSRVATNR